jgi:hypothetical protein
MDKLHDIEVLGVSLLLKTSQVDIRFRQTLETPTIYFLYFLLLLGFFHLWRTAPMGLATGSIKFPQQSAMQ